MKKIGIIMGSDSDLPVMKEAGAILDALGVDYEMTVVSAHRTPKRLMEYAESAAARGLEVIVAGAGGAAHLPGMVASFTGHWCTGSNQNHEWDGQFVFHRANASRGSGGYGGDQWRKECGYFGSADFVGWR